MMKTEVIIKKEETPKIIWLNDGDVFLWKNKLYMMLNHRNRTIYSFESGDVFESNNGYSDVRIVKHLKIEVLA